MIKQKGVPFLEEDICPHFTLYQCTKCGFNDYRLNCSDNDKCEDCCTDVKILYGRGRFNRRIKLCVFCHTVFTRGKREDGHACGTCKRYLRENIICTNLGVLYDNMPRPRCYICTTILTVSRYCFRNHNTCWNTHCTSVFLSLQRRALLSCLRRLNVSKDMRVYIAKKVEGANFLATKKYLV